jgi:hypothetical protein
LGRISQNCSLSGDSDGDGYYIHEYHCGANAVHVLARATLGVVGGTNYGCASGSCLLPIHLHFEAKDFSGLHAPGLAEWGYTTSHPYFEGYFDPTDYLDGTILIAPSIKVKFLANGNLRLGPRSGDTGYPIALSEPAGFTAWARQLVPGTPGCSLGWYQIYQSSDQKYPPDKVNYFVSASFAQLPDAWVCRGDGSDTWVTQQ